MDALPRLVLIADRFTRPERAEQAVAAVEAGVRWVHLRDHTASEVTFAEAAATLAQRCRTLRPGLHLTVNARLDVARALEAGLHLGRRGPSVAAAREDLGDAALLGFSAHDEDAGRAAIEDGADYLTYSPVFPTSSKPGHPGTGIEALRRFCRAMAPCPVLALGGITPEPERVAACRAAGAHGVAVLSGIMDAARPAQAVRAYLEALRSPPNPKSKTHPPKST